MASPAFTAPVAVQGAAALGARPMAVGVRRAVLGERDAARPCCAKVQMTVSRRALISAAAAAAMVMPAVAVSSDRPMLAAVAATAAAPVAVAATAVPGGRKETVAMTPSTATSVKAAPPPVPPQPELVAPLPKKVAWGYVGQGAPENWGKLAPEFTACSNVGTQSPVALSYRNAVIVEDQRSKPTLNITPARFICKRRNAGPNAANPFFFFDVYKPQALAVEDDDDDEPAPPPASPATLSVPGVGNFDLLGFHFHAPSSEHVLETAKSVMEVHFVFGKRKVENPPPPSTMEEARAAMVEEGAPAFFASVLGILFEEGPKSPPFFRQVLTVATPKGQSPKDFPEAGRLVDFDLREFIPSLEKVDLFNYSGSLTTPPGTEGVLWWVVSERAKVKPEDVVRLTQAQGGPNSRPIQALGTRRVLRYVRPSEDEDA